MPGPTRRAHILPSHGKAQRLQFRPHHFRYSLHSCEIQAPAILIYQLLQQGDAALMFGIHGGGHMDLGRSQLGM